MWSWPKYGRFRIKDLMLNICRCSRVRYNDTCKHSGNLDYKQEKPFSPKLQKSEEILEIRKKLKFSFSEFRKNRIDNLPNRSDRSNPLHSIKFISESDLHFLCWNSQSFHIHSEGVSSFTTQNISWTGSFRTFIVHGRRTAPDRVQKRSEFGRK